MTGKPASEASANGDSFFIPTKENGQGLMIVEKLNFKLESEEFASFRVVSLTYL